MKRVWKNVLALVVAVALLLGTTSVQAAELTKPDSLGKHYAYTVMDARTGTVLLSSNINKKIYPASTAKLVTAMVLIDHGDLSQKIKITKKMLKAVPYDSSKYGLKAGQRYTLKTLLNLILVNSSGDAAVAAAVGVFGSTKACVKAMNKKAKAIGCTNTHFDNVIGLDKGNDYYKTYSTSYDMAIYTRYAMSYSLIQKIVEKDSYRPKQTNGTKGHRVNSTNLFYCEIDYSDDLYTIIGTKTGTTNAAGHVFAATAMDDDGHEIICVYNGKVSAARTFKDIAKLLDTVYTADQEEGLALSDGSISIHTSLDEADMSIYADAASSEATGVYTIADASYSLGACLLDASTGCQLTDLYGTVTYAVDHPELATVDANGLVTFYGSGQIQVTISVAASAYFDATSRVLTINHP